MTSSSTSLESGQRVSKSTRKTCWASAIRRFLIYQKLGFDIIGMTALPEAKLAREAEICYSMIATVTDYDVWHEEDVTIETVIANAMKNEEAVRNIIKEAIPRISLERKCICSNALAGAIITAPDKIPVEIRRKLNDLVGKYL